MSLQLPSRSRPAIALLAALCLFPPPSAAQSEQERLEPAVRSFEESDRANAPPTGGIVFLGSSSFRRWDLDRWFPGMDLINRGFGGSQMADALRYLDRIILPLEPRTLFIYEGDNDIANGKRPATVEAEFRELAARVHARLPGTRIVVVGVKPSIRRWHLIEEVRAVNSRLRAVTESHPLLTYIDVEAPLLGPDGQPRPELFVADDLHLSDAGYAIWTELVRPYID